MRVIRPAFVVIFWLASVLTATAQAADQPAKSPIFETDILPIFKAKCASCHNPRAKKAELDLTTLDAVAKGGESGELIVGGKPDDSLLYEMIHEGLMPPEDFKKPLTKAEIETISRWIQAGAKSKNGDALSKADLVTQHDIIPLMNLRCTVCHGLRKQEAGLDLRSKSSMLKGGKSGPAIVLGKPEESLILKRLHAAEMPPRKLLVRFGIRPMNSAEIAMLSKWIAADGPEVEMQLDVATTAPDPLVTDEDRKFWAFQKPNRPAVPRVNHQALVRNPLDAFLLKTLEGQQLSYSPEADKLTLIRRVAFDLTGLAPDWKDVETFLADDSPKAYEKMVARYLASKRYGERWGQYWLDLAGYADSEGKRSADPIRPHAWRYRDYVIRAFNADKPYDRFLLEQIAGDELADYEHAAEVTPQMYDNLVATAFLRMAPDGTGSDIVDTAVERMEVIADELNIFTAGILGLTMKCAQCHSHKYDPIPQRDYYRLMAVFKGAYDEHDWLKPSFVPGQTETAKAGRVLVHVLADELTKWQADKLQHEQRVTAAQQKLKQPRKLLIEKLRSERIAKLPAEVQEKVKQLLGTPKPKRNAEQKQLAAKYEASLKFDDKKLSKADSDFKKLAAATAKQVKELTAKAPKQPQIRALWDRGVPSPTYIYRRGDVTNPDRLVGPGVPAVLTDGKTPFDVQPPWPGANKSGRRLALARWLIEPNHPLTSRVMINRIWKFHFGRGIVKSLGNFGHTGSRPTQPELLDWLSREFIDREWSIKQMHRLMMTSSAYRQSSQMTDKLAELDPENALLSRMPLRRMEAEVVRDSVLLVAGRLDETRFGQPDPVSVRPDGLVTSTESKQGWRRSIYVQHRRKEMPTILENFDLPQMIPNCVERPSATVASQALHLSNDSMILKLSGQFAERVQTEAGTEPYRQIEHAYQIALSRPPTDEEKQVSLETLAALTKRWKAELGGEADKDNEAEKRALVNLCHTLINSAAFLYVD
ncbi:MAG: DUF1553 domain-containing protein [Planctomycetaceae bacterium]|nr:DUF1553 domain-containing protein [Planctomycetaceae bacterium]